MSGCDRELQVLKEHLQNHCPCESVEPPKIKKVSWWEKFNYQKWGLAALAVIVGAFVFTGFLKMKGKQDTEVADAHSTVLTMPYPQPSSDDVWEKQRVNLLEKQNEDYHRLEANVKTLDTKIDDSQKAMQVRLEEGLQLLQDRQVLMRIVDTHNVHALRTGNYIFIRSDWTINRMPDNVQLSEDMKQFVVKFVKP